MIDRYFTVMSGCFCRNVLTSLYITVPVDETVLKNYFSCRILVRRHCLLNFDCFQFIFANTWTLNYVDDKLNIINKLNDFNHFTVYKLFKFLIQIPVCTLSPIFSSNIVTDIPLSSITFAIDGKHPRSISKLWYCQSLIIYCTITEVPKPLLKSLRP